MRTVWAVLCGAFLLGPVAGCSQSKVETPDNPAPKPTVEPTPITVDAPEDPE